MMEPDIREEYRAYVGESQESVHTRVAPPVPERLAEEVEQVPLVAALWFSSSEPVVRTLSLMRAPDPDEPDLLIRCDLTPFAPAWRVSIGEVAEDYDSRPLESYGTVAVHLARNGRGFRIRTPQFFPHWPTAIMVCPALARLAPIIATGVFDGTTATRPPLEAELARMMRHTMDPWYRELDQARSEGRDGEAAATTAHVAATSPATGTHGSPCRSPGSPPSWTRFLAWWSLVTSPGQLVRTLKALTLAWAGAVQGAPLPACVDTTDAERWISPFAAAYAAGPVPGDPNPAPANRAEETCELYGAAQIRPATGGLSVHYRDDPPDHRDDRFPLFEAEIEEYVRRLVAQREMEDAAGQA